MVKTIIKISTDINQIKTMKGIQRINRYKSSFFEKIQKIDRPFTRVTKNEKQNKTQTKLEAPQLHNGHSKCTEVP